MIFYPRQVPFLIPTSQNFISAANGNLTMVIGERSSILNDTFKLNYIWVTPSLHYNLLSISQITNALSCVIIFWLDHYGFKDIQVR